jgi:hypothetical protein
MLHDLLLGHFLQNAVDSIHLSFCVQIILIFVMNRVLKLKYQPGYLKVKINFYQSDYV